VQKLEHIERYERILAGLLYSLDDGKNCEYLRGAHAILRWVMQPESETFEMRSAGVKLVDDAIEEEVHE
jgi:hypothetical protein